MLNPFVTGSTVHSHYTRHCHEPRSAQHKHTKYNNSILHLGPKLWNDLTEQQKNLTNVKSFKSMITKSKLSQY